MIRRPDNFPDVDRVIEEADRAPAVLPYRGVDPHDRPSDESTIHPWRRLGLIFALAALSGGLGESLHPGGQGAVMMTLGGIVLGMILPIPGVRRSR